MAIILGLRCDGDTVVFQKKKTQTTFEEKYLSKTYEGHRDFIKKTFLQIVRKKGEEDNFVRLLMMYLMGTIIFSNTSYSILN